MIKPKDYDSIQAVTYGDAESLTLEPGGHGVMILKAQTQTDQYGEKLVLLFDIAEGGASDGFFTAKFDRAKKFNPDAKFPGVFKQPILGKDGATSPYFKGLITAIEKSNPGYVWNWQEQTLKNKRVGLVFREEEFVGQDGETHTTVRAAWACDWDSYPAMPVPKKKEAKKPQPSLPFGDLPQQPQLTQEDDDDLPF